MKMKIRKGDTVEVISGAEIDKGRRGEVIKVMPKDNRVVVQGINMSKKHQRQYQVEGRQMEGGIIEFEAPLSASNVMYVCPKCGNAARLGVHRDDDGTAHRVCKSCSEQVD
jgi:large subunit ribosomal protein L24